MASGLAAVGGTAEKIGLDGVRSAIEEARAERLAEIASQIKMRDEDTLRTRNKDDADTDRARVAEFSRPMTNQPNGLISAGAGADSADNAGADENIGAFVQKTSRDSTQRERQNRASAAGDLVSAERFGRDADRSEDNALNSKRLDEAAKRQDAWTANESTKRENEAKRIEAMFARIGAQSKDKTEKTPTRVAEAQQIMENINKDRVAAGKPKITFEDALAMHFRATDPGKETVKTDSDGNVMERSTTRPIGDKGGETRKVVKFGDLK